ncbi:MAG: hypothetical protein H7Z40_19140 [Phycisphaerae bacterium]|nr:hypothetical protein [Gemmatimonadaceae bacterium]
MRTWPVILTFCATSVHAFDGATELPEKPKRVQRTLPATELSIGGVSIGDTEASVLARFGTPTARVDDGEWIELQFDGLSVWPQQPGSGLGDPDTRRVGEISSTSPKFCTPSLICPGQDFAEVEKRFGAPMIAEREHGTFMEYGGEGTTCWLQIALDQRTIKSVRTECQP